MLPHHPRAADRARAVPRTRESIGSHQAAVARVITTFRRSGGQTLLLTTLANGVGLSRFHFNRIFHRIVGIPPGQFQSLLRLDLARRLLLTTSRAIIDVSLDVGYESLGTFTRRFTDTLGLPPLRLRHAAQLVLAGGPEAPVRDVLPHPVRGALQGTITAPSDFARGIVLIGLFGSPVPRGYPERCCVVDGPGPFSFGDVEDGVYYVMAAAFAADAGPAQWLLHDGILRAAHPSPLVVRDGTVISGGLDLSLRGPHPFDPPILTALLPLLADRDRGSAAPRTSNRGEDSAAVHVF